MLGRAGIGKTTLCRRLAYQWATGELWADRYDWVFLLTLKELVTRYAPTARYSLADILYPEVFSVLALTPEQARQFCQTLLRDPSKSKVLFILDGYDEVVALNHPAVNCLLTQAPHYVVTSRPSGHILQDKGIDLTLETLGFTDDNIRTYISRFFQRATVAGDGADLTAWLKHNPGLNGLVHIPINLELVCQLWSQ